MVRRIQVTPYIYGPGMVREPFDLEVLVSGSRIDGTPYVLAPDDGGGTVLPPVGDRLPWQYPFASDSVWNTSVGSGLTYVATNDSRHTQVINSAGSVNSTNWSDPVYLAKDSDPAVTVRHVEYLPVGWDTLSNTQSGTTSGAGPFVKEYTNVRVPVGAAWQSTTNTDRKVHVVQPNGINSIEIHKFYRTSDPALIYCTNLSNTDLRYSGLNAGAIASQISPTGGLIRNFEVAAAKAGNVNAISHVLRVSMTAHLLKVGIIWPSKGQDSSTTYHIGQNEYGTMLVLDKAVDIETLRYPTGVNGARLLNSEEKALAYCLQDYGGYVLIRSGSNAADIIGLQVEARSVDSTAVNNMKTAWQQVLIPKLRIATNSHQVGTLNADRTPQDPDLISGGGTRRRDPLPPISPTGPWV